MWFRIFFDKIFLFSKIFDLSLRFLNSMAYTKVLIELFWLHLFVHWKSKYFEVLQVHDDFHYLIAFHVQSSFSFVLQHDHLSIILFVCLTYMCNVDGEHNSEESILLNPHAANQEVDNSLPNWFSKHSFSHLWINGWRYMLSRNFFETLNVKLPKITVDSLIFIIRIIDT